MSRPCPITVELLAQVRSRPEYIAFCALLDQRIANGKTLDVQKVLEAIGAPGAIAHGIIEEWPQQGKKHVLRYANLTRTEIVACWLACHIDDVGAHDWKIQLLKAGRVLMGQRLVQLREARWT